MGKLEYVTHDCEDMDLQNRSGALEFRIVCTGTSESSWSIYQHGRKLCLDSGDHGILMLQRFVSKGRKYPFSIGWDTVLIKC